MQVDLGRRVSTRCASVNKLPRDKWAGHPCSDRDISRFVIGQASLSAFGRVVVIRAGVNLRRSCANGLRPGDQSRFMRPTPRWCQVLPFDTALQEARPDTRSSRSERDQYPALARPRVHGRGQRRDHRGRVGHGRARREQGLGGLRRMPGAVEGRAPRTPARGWLGSLRVTRNREGRPRGQHAPRRP